jgi:8-oxo-dGTP pyrophosphatase MutT (NUDIX family)
VIANARRKGHISTVMTIAQKVPQTIYTEPEFRVRAAAALHRGPSDSIFDPRTGRAWARSDWDLNPELLADFEAMEPARAAAVLVPIVARPELTVLLTERTAHLATHAGQIAFPGGKVEPDDPDPVHTALREAEEEIGLSRTLVEPLGFLDGYRTGTGFLVTPVVALVTPDFTLSIDPGEVASAFEVPLAFLMDSENHKRHSREWRGRQRHYYAMPFGDRYIWGATAGMLKNLQEGLYPR